jgi:predicted RNA-binding protein (virulence factor B family)
MPRDYIYYEKVIGGVDVLMTILRKKPRYLKLGYRSSPESILDSYGMGDLTFNQAVRALEKWKKSKY